MPDLTLSMPLLITGSVAIATGAVASRAMFSPRSGLLGPVVYRAGADCDGRLGLTFDDGPDPRTTPRILDILGDAGAKATFFVIGAHARRHPDLIRRIHEGGHLLGNHSFHHHYTGMFRFQRYWQQELQRADEAIADATGRTPAWFRPPMGMRNIHLARVLKRGGYRVVTWSRSARDGIDTSVPGIVHRVGERAKAGDIVLLHDGVDRPGREAKAATVAALPLLMSRLCDRGLSIEPLDALIGATAYRQPGCGALPQAAGA